MKTFKLLSLICLLGTVAPAVAETNKSIGDSTQAKAHTHSEAEDAAAYALRKCIAQRFKERDAQNQHQAHQSIKLVKNQCQAEILELYLISRAHADSILNLFEEVISKNKLSL